MHSNPFAAVLLPDYTCTSDLELSTIIASYYYDHYIILILLIILIIIVLFKYKKISNIILCNSSLTSISFFSIFPSPLSPFCSFLQYFLFNNLIHPQLFIIQFIPYRFISFIQFPNLFPNCINLYS